MEKEKVELIKSQFAKSGEKLNAARSLCRDGYIDDSISRAYYAMFHAASAVLLAEGIKVDSHNALKTMFGLQLIKSGKIDKKYGRWLTDVKDERENGDYDIFTTFEKEDAEEDLKRAEKFIEKMKAFLQKEHDLLL